MGEKRDYLTIKILHNNMTVMVPCENAHGRGPPSRHRRGAGEEGRSACSPTTSPRCRRTGTAGSSTTARRSRPATSTELAEVVRNLAIREMEKGLSTGEKQMYTRAKKILASEFMYVAGQGRGGRRGVPGRAARGELRRSQGDCLERLPSATAVIAAAGSGERLGAGGPKAFVEVARPAAAGLVAGGVRRRRARSSAIVVAAPPAREDRCRRGGRARPASRSRSSPGASTARSRSPTRSSEVETELVVVHDAARPLVTAELIDEIVGRLDARPRRRRGDRGRPGHRHDQGGLGLAAGAPHPRPLAAVGGADAAGVPHRAACGRRSPPTPTSSASATDDAMLVERTGGEVLIHEAPAENLKVTTPLDLKVAGLLLAERSA